MIEEKKEITEEEKDMTEEEMDMIEEKMGIVTETSSAKKKPARSSWGGLKMWWAVMLIYIFIFTYVGYIAFWPMAFNDPNNTVKKYLTILKDYQAENGKLEGDTLNLAMEELMKKAEEAANDMQQLASQSFNIVLGAFLAFLSATVTTIFQKAGRNKDPDPETTG